MKRNRSKYVVYFEPWAPGRHKTVTSKYQAKKLLQASQSGSEMIKIRLIHHRDGSVSFWNADHNYSPWIKI